MLGTWCSHGKYYTSSCYSYSDPGSMRALYASAMLCSLLLGFLPPTGVSTWIELWHCDMTNSNSDMIDEMWTLFHTSLFLLFPPPLHHRQEQKGPTKPAGSRKSGRSEPCPTGACGRQTFSGGSRRCELGRLTRGWRTWLGPSGLTSPSATGWATIILSPSLSLRSEGTDLRVWGRVTFNGCLQFKQPKGSLEDYISFIYRSTFFPNLWNVYLDNMEKIIEALTL